MTVEATEVNDKIRTKTIDALTQLFVDHFPGAKANPNTARALAEIATNGGFQQVGEDDVVLSKLQFEELKKVLTAAGFEVTLEEDTGEDEPLQEEDGNVEEDSDTPFS